MRRSASFLAFATVCLIAACDSGTGSNGGSPNPADLVGSWKGVNVQIDTGYDIYTDTTLYTFGVDGRVTSLTHERDSSLTNHTVVFNTFADTGTWTTSGNKITFTVTSTGKSFSITYAISGTKLTLTDQYGPFYYTRQ
jgi:uncharacterized protein (DUF2147 family)